MTHNDTSPEDELSPGAKATLWLIIWLFFIIPWCTGWAYTIGWIVRNW